MYIYGGYLLTGGKLDDGTPWQGINLLFGEIPQNAEEPLSGMIGKARRTDSMMQTLSTLPIGCPVEVVCDLRGKVTGINVVKASDKR